jgi:hypothetical protein
MESAQLRFLRAVAGYRMMDHKRDEDMKEELKITDISRYSRLNKNYIKMIRRFKNKTR